MTEQAGKSAFVLHEGKLLRKGYTTGTCAAAAAKAAVLGLLAARCPEQVAVDTAEGELLLPVVSARLEGAQAVCCVRKDAGDDPDVTDGILVCASVQLNASGTVVVTGGTGVGRVTKPGLRVPVGHAAINPAPLQQITSAVRRVLPDGSGAEVEISVPEGEAVAQRTFNPRLGIVGGISILGTTGIVTPMSEEAYRESLALRLDQLAALGVDGCAFTFGEYGKDLAATLGLDSDRCVTTSNFVGYMLDHAVARGFRRILLIGHLGKIIKLAAGIWQTHNRQADGRMETLTAFAGLEGGEPALLREIFTCVTTSAVVDILDGAGLGSVYQRVANAIQTRAWQRAGEGVTVEAIVYTDGNRILAETAGAADLADQLRR